MNPTLPICDPGWWLTNHPLSFVLLIGAATALTLLLAAWASAERFVRSLWLFQSGMLSVAVLSTGLLTTKAVCYRPASVGVLPLLILFTSAIILATLGPELFRRIQTLKIGSFEMVLQSVIAHFDLSVPTLTPTLTPEEDPFQQKPLTARQRWEFQRGVDLFLYLDHQKLDPYEFSLQDRQKYRDFLLRLGWAAVREGKYEFVRTLVEKVEELMRQESTRSGKRLPPLRAEELYRIGNAYLYAADADAMVDEREAERGWRDALRVYEQVDLAKTPNAFVAMHRGWAHIQLKEYHAAHALLASLDLSRFEEGARPYLKLDLACAKIRLGKAEGGDTKRRLWEEALRVLEEIEPGYWWEKHIIKDDDVQLLFKDDVLRLRLEDLITFRCKNDSSPPDVWRVASVRTCPNASFFLDRPAGVARKS